MSNPSVSDKQRDRMAAEIAAALLLIYRGKIRQALDRIGRLHREAVISVAVEAKLRAFAADRAQKIQDGINQRVQSAVEGLPPDATEGDRAAALSTVAGEVSDYNRNWLIPYLASYAAHEALIATYSDEEDPQNPDRTVAESRMWVWQQVTEFDDECQEAASASPASLDDLLGIAGGPPPRHPHCDCSLDIA